MFGEGGLELRWFLVKTGSV